MHSLIVYVILEKNECSDPHMNACDENADCVKKPDGYACLCQKGFYDVSTSANLAPGRVCSLRKPKLLISIYSMTLTENWRNLVQKLIVYLNRPI